MAFFDCKYEEKDGSEAKEFGSRHLSSMETFLTFCSDQNVFGPSQKQPAVPGVQGDHPSGGVLTQNSKISAIKIEERMRDE